MCNRVVPVHIQRRSGHGPLVGVAREDKVQRVVGGGGKARGRHLAGDDRREVEEIEALVVDGRGARIGGVLGGGAVVAKDGGWVRVVGTAAEVAAAKRDIEPIVVDGLACVDGHVVALADADEEAVGGVRVDGDEVSLDDGHGVVDDGDLHVVLNTRVDEAEAVALARGQGDGGVLAIARRGVLVGTVDEDVVASRRSVGLSVDHDLVRGLVVVVSHQQRT